jgi:threonylcarbamoyladenosine tRNA methylthiotransferase MtaB
VSAAARVDVISLGCRLNIVESETMRRQALAAGHRDLTIVNTCAVTAEAMRQGRQAVRRAHAAHPAGELVVTGCGAEIDRPGFAALPGVGRLIPNGEKTAAAAWPHLATGLAAHAPDSRQAHTRGFVAIQNGCDHRCTFCVIPFGRGASRSTSADAVIAQVAALAETGVQDVVLTGVDLTSYGIDLPGTPTLGTLVRRLLRAVPALPRLRLSSIDCVEADPALIEAFATEPRLMPHLHLSLQAGSDLILKRMKRRHSRQDSIAFCATLRRLRPDIVFGADLIAGFPTETETQFADTLSLVDACGLTHIHAFPYSARPGTPAARMPPVEPAVARDRAARLRALGAARLGSHLDSYAGRRVPVLTERGGHARTADFTLVRLDGDPDPGRLQTALIGGHDGRALAGTLA